mmetsp:Transcript_39190/g.84532  ORF Transcript_39190/g.84532 Transcript_39190/m.84532 type:complete len:361 (-) Transcript_39190:839-1921(-)
MQPIISALLIRSLIIGAKPSRARIGKQQCIIFGNGYISSPCIFINPTAIGVPRGEFVVYFFYGQNIPPIVAVSDKLKARTGKFAMYPSVKRITIVFAQIATALSLRARAVVVAVRLRTATIAICLKGCSSVYYTGPDRPVAGYLQQIEGFGVGAAQEPRTIRIPRIPILPDVLVHECPSALLLAISNHSADLFVVRGIIELVLLGVNGPSGVSSIENVHAVKVRIDEIHLLLAPGRVQHKGILPNIILEMNSDGFAVIVPIVLLDRHDRHPRHQHAEIEDVQCLHENSHLLPAGVRQPFERRAKALPRRRALQPLPEHVHLGQSEGDVVHLLQKLQGEDVEEDFDHGRALRHDGEHVEVE